MGDAHAGVVGHDGEVVGGGAVAPEDHEVLDLAVVEAQVAVHHVAPFGGPVGDKKPHREGLPASCPAVTLFRGDSGRQIARQTGHRAGTRGHGLVADPGEFLLGREVAVGPSLAQETKRVGTVPLHAIGLEDGLLVPVDSQPGEPAQDRLHMLRTAAIAVGVLDAQEEGAAVSARQQPVEERRAGPADVKVSRRRGSKPESHSVVPFIQSSRGGPSRSFHLARQARKGYTGCTPGPTGTRRAAGSDPDPAAA